MPYVQRHLSSPWLMKHKSMMTAISSSKYKLPLFVARKFGIASSYPAGCTFFIHELRRHCSELHVYRGHQPSDTGFIMGHEFTGIVVEAGARVKTLKVGDKVVSPFTTCWFVRPE